MEIWKFVLRPGVVELDMPIGARTLTVHEQRGQCCLWAEVNIKMPATKRQFEVYGTGRPLENLTDSIRRYVGTVYMDGGELVWHVYEIPEEGDEE